MSDIQPLCGSVVERGRAGPAFRTEDYFKGLPLFVFPRLERQGGDVHRSLRFCECSSYTYEDVKTVVDVLQRAVLGKARGIRYLALMSSRSAAGTADCCS